MRVSVITPTCDRPVGIALCERFMARQSFMPDEWIVADGGEHPAPLTMGQIHLCHPQPRGAGNFAANLLNGLATARGELIVFIEDDDHLAPDHLETMLRAAQAAPRGALAIGDDRQTYYNVTHRCWREFNNVGASLCQTAIRREAVPALVAIIRQCMARNTYGIDTTFWRSIPRERWALTGRRTVVGIKGLPGAAGLGISVIIVDGVEGVGADAALYAGFAARAAA